MAYIGMKEQMADRCYGRGQPCRNGAARRLKPNRLENELFQNGELVCFGQQFANDMDEHGNTGQPADRRGRVENGLSGMIYRTVLTDIDTLRYVIGDRPMHKLQVLEPGI